MAGKKNDFNYFEAYVKAVGYACEASDMLKNAVNDLCDIHAKMEKVHAIENCADEVYHELVNSLSRAFITPLESEDLKALGQMIDNVVDTVEDVVVNLYIMDIKSVREEAVEFAEHISKCCDALKIIVAEFANFKKSKKIAEYIVAVNDIEEQGDRLYHRAIRRLFTEETDALEIIRWRRLFELMERCCDSCEDVADTMESVILKNT